MSWVTFWQVFILSAWVLIWVGVAGTMIRNAGKESK